MLASFIRFFLDHKLVAYLLSLLFVGWGLVTAPFDFNIPGLPRDPVAVDAIPDIGENQQIVFTKWMGRSPQDVEDQLTYPLTSALLGIPGVKSVRSNSMFGFSSIYLIFEDDIDFYWSRSRILEKLNSLAPNLLPQGVQPTLGPDATALGQIYWYTLEGRDKKGKSTGGWDLQELRAVQDFYVRYGLSSAEGVAEVASIGGYVKEYQIDLDPEAMKIHGVSMEQLMRAVKGSNIDIGAQTMEINLAEYFVRGIGYVKSIEDIERSVVKVVNNTPLYIRDIAHVQLGPATRRGILDKSGAEAVGGVVVARYGANPLEVIQNVKQQIVTLSSGLPTKTLADGTVSQVQIIPFYDRTQLINETIGTLQEALSLEILITVIVVLLLLLHFKSSLLVAGTLPIAVLMCFIAMRYFGVDANIVALSGIAIAIGTMVDMGIVLTESMVNRLQEAPPEESLKESIFQATQEVASAVITAVATTVISFLPVFTMEAAEGKLFTPLAYTKTFALVASIIVALAILPALAHTLFSIKLTKKWLSYAANLLLLILGVGISLQYSTFLGIVITGIGVLGIIQQLIVSYGSERLGTVFSIVSNIIYALGVTYLLAIIWMPLGVNKSEGRNFFFIVLLAGGLIGFFYLMIYWYEPILRFLLRFKLLFLLLVSFIVYQGFIVFKNTGEEFMPALDEGSFLLMPTSMPHSGMQENLKNLRLLDMAVTAIPEVETVVGKAGRVNSALDPAPMSMYENVILYKSEYKTDEQGHRLRFKYENGEYIRDEKGQLITDTKGRYFRQWRDEINSPDDIWNEIVKVTKLPGVTSAPKLQPIETRLVMLQTGMRAPMGIKVQGSDLATIEEFGLQLEKHLKEVKGVKVAAVFADRIVGKPYLLLEIKRDVIARYGLTIQQVQQHIQAAVGGMNMTTTVEGRERYNIRVRYPRALRDDPESLRQIYVSTPTGATIPLGQLVDIQYEQGAQAIKSENGFLIGYVLFDREKGFSEVEVVERAQQYLTTLIDSGRLEVPAGINYRFAGNYEQQVRANKRLQIVVPIALALIFLILYFQFNSVLIALMVFTGVFVAFSGGFIMIGLYDTSWFLDVAFFGVNMRDLFQIQTLNLSIAVWVGFLALFGIATDDGVLVATFLKDSFKKNQPTSIPAIRDAVVEGGLRRVRPAMMTTATTILALLPVLTATGRGADIMLPMAIPSFGGMTFQIITMFTVPILYALWQEWKLRFQQGFTTKKSVAATITLLLLLSGSSFAQSLASLVEKLPAQNLELQALQQDYQASLEVMPQVGQRPDPEVGLGIYPLPVETRLGAQLTRLSVSQKLPWFGVLDQQKELATAKTTVVYQQIENTFLEQRYQLKKAYYQLYELEQKLEIIVQNQLILESLEQVALAQIASGKGTTADVLQVQLKQNSLIQELKIIQTQKRIPNSVINQLLHQAVDQVITTTDSLRFALLPINKDSLLANIVQQHPKMIQFNQQKEVHQKILQLNDLAAKPTFGVGMDYILVNGRNDADPMGNGRDILQVRGTIKIPLNKQQYQAKEREEQLKMAAIEQRKIALYENFIAAIERAYATYEMAQLEYELASQQLEITNATIEILETNYSVNGSRFDELLQLESQQINYQLQQLMAIVKSHQAINEVERFIPFKLN